MRVRSGAAFLLVAMACAACPPPAVSDAGTDASVVDAGDDVDAYCSGYAHALCARQVACGSAEATQVAACELQLAGSCERTLGGPARAGSIRLQAGALDVCSRAIDSWPCLSLSQSVHDCTWGDGIFAPAGQPGTPCSWETCVDGVCDFASWSCGACAAPTPLGQPCGRCDPKAAFCNTSNVCEAKHADGAACTWRDQCLSGVCNPLGQCGPGPKSAPCRGEVECTPSMFCQGLSLEPNIAGSCWPRVDAGAPCTFQQWDSTGGCERGTACLDGYCTGPDAGSLPEGAECTWPLQCAGDATCTGLSGPGTLGHCAATRIGAACLGEMQYCPAGARCIDGPDGGVCAQLRGPGEPCTLQDSRWDDCRAGLACVGGEDGGLVCGPLLNDGASCDFNWQCLSLRCASLRCRAPGAAGEACTQGSDCASGACDSLQDGGHACLASCF